MSHNKCYILTIIIILLQCIIINYNYFVLSQPNAQYQFSFDISDDESTNYHNRKEQRDGEKISGSYSVVDSDGFIRTVTYTADPEEVSSSNLM